MADPKDDLPDFEDLKLPEDEFFAAEPDGETPLPESAAAELLPALGPPAELEETAAVEETAEPRAEEAETEQKSKQKKPKKVKPPKQKRPPKEKPPREKRPPSETAARLLRSLRRANPYVVMLAIALLALVIAIFCLLMELGRYGFHIKASSTGPAAPVGATAQSGPANTIATA